MFPSSGWHLCLFVVIVPYFTPSTPAARAEEAARKAQEDIVLGGVWALAASFHPWPISVA